jgi:5-methylcytosine-specific restriction endonuclease McrA
MEKELTLEKVCITCGKTFIPKNRRTKYCSVTCRRKLQRQAEKIVKRIRDREKAVPKTPRICHECGVMFTPKYGEKRRKFCSRECMKRSIRRNNEHVWRQRIRDNAGEPVHKWQIILRDGGKCQICGRKVKVSKEVPHPLSPTLDHIIPLSKGGKHDPQNVRLAHFICNLKKKDGISDGGDQLRLFG